MTYTIKLRRGLSSDWTVVNPILAEGEFGYELDTRNFKIGDGSTTWNLLEYVIDTNDRLPDASGLTDNQILLSFGGEWTVVELPSSLPNPAGLPDGKMLGVVSEEWVVVDAPISGGGTGYLGRKNFVSTAGQTEFALDAVDLDVIVVTLNGITLDSIDYTLAGSTLTLDEPTVLGDGVSVFWNSDGTPPPSEPVVGPPGPPGGAEIINNQTGTNYTLLITDAQKFIRMSNAAASTLTVPLNSSVAFPVGTVIKGSQSGAGQVTLTPVGGVTINATPGLKVAAQYGVFALVKVDTDTWLAFGRLAA